MTGRMRVLGAGIAAWSWLAAAVATAHEVRPVALDIQERGAALYSFTLRIPASVAPDNRPVMAWPADCEASAAGLLRCGQPLAGRRVELRWPLYNPSVTTLARYTPRAGAVRAAVLPPEATHWTVPAEPTAPAVARGYFLLGVGHILGGADHLLFVGGLLLVARGLRRIVLAVSGFTLAHSLTLSLAALGVVRVPVPPTEAAIALSVLFLAREALRPEDASLVRRFPLLASVAFGLLHGLGFAAALGEAGLPDREVAWALLSFNLGVEAGQLAFILAATGIFALAMRATRGRMQQPGRWLGAGQTVAAYLIGIPAAFWLLQRMSF